MSDNNIINVTVTKSTKSNFENSDRVSYCNTLEYNKPGVQIPGMPEGVKTADIKRTYLLFTGSEVAEGTKFDLNLDLFEVERKEYDKVIINDETGEETVETRTSTYLHVKEA